MRALIPVLAIAVIALAAVAIVAIRSRAQQARQTRQELARHEKFLNHLRRASLNAAAVDPTSAALTDEIAHHLANPKENR